VVGLGEASAGGGDSSGTQGVVWDHAAFHKAKVVGEVGLRRLYRPPCSPELNTAERVLKEVRRWLKGRRYDGMEVKQAAVEGCREDWRPGERSHHSWGGTISVKLSMSCSYYFCPYGGILPSE
jgi:transposase